MTRYLSSGAISAHNVLKDIIELIAVTKVNMQQSKIIKFCIKEVDKDEISTMKK